MSFSKALKKSLALLGKVQKSHVGKVNKAGHKWLAALDVAEETVLADFPTVTGMQLAGALAHQSHSVERYSNVLSVKFFPGEERVISGHIHINGAIDYSQRARTSGQASGGSGGGWQPTRDEVDQQKWTIYDPEKKKHRAVLSEGKWWYIKKGADKIYSRLGLEVARSWRD